MRSLDTAMQGHTVLVRGRVYAVRGTGKMAFLVVRKPAVGRSKCDELGNGEIREQDQQGVHRGCRRHCFCS